MTEEHKSAAGEAVPVMTQNFIHDFIDELTRTWGRVGSSKV